jgi:hypothetical protein
MKQKKNKQTLLSVKTKPVQKRKVGVVQDDRKDQKDDRQENKHFLISDFDFIIKKNRLSQF